MKQLTSTLLFLFLCSTLYAQMWNGQDTLYGNEWIRYDQSYFKLKVAEDGMYRLGFEEMQAAGIPLASIQGQQFQLYHLGQEVPIYVNNNSNWTSGDFLEFYGQKNRSELDQYLVADPDSNLLNLEYSMYTDSSAYYLTWANSPTTPLRYEVIANDLTNLPTAETWYWANSKEIFTKKHFKRYLKTSGADIYYSNFDGDGFAHEYTEETIFSLSAADCYEGGPSAELSLSMIGNANATGHNLQISVNNNVLENEEFYGTELKKYNIPLAPPSLGKKPEIAVRGLNETDRLAVAYGTLRYPREFSFDQEEELQIELPAREGPRYLELRGLGSAPLLIVEPSTNLRILTSISGGIHRVKLPARSGTRKLILSTLTAIRPINNLRAIEFTDFEASNASYLILSNEQLFDDGSGNNWVQAYADYRSSTAGGNYSVQIIEVKQFYDQFAYGVDYHPLSIKNASNYLRKYKLKDLEFFFIMGRGQEFPGMRDQETLQAAIEAGNMLVPTFGYPASDNLLFTENNESNISALPIGRLAAINGQEVKIYLDKVKALEANKDLPQTIADRAWTKNILHLGGGSNAGEQSSIRNRLEFLANTIETSTFGGSVRAFYKNSTDAIQNSLSQEIFDFINQGTSIITFFGHSSPGTFDFNIDNPENYENAGKYPLILSLGCYSGNIFAGSRSIGERFTFYEDKAGVVFGASRGLGFISSLANFASTFYNNFGNEYYGKSIGEAMRATYLDHQEDDWIGMTTLVQQFTIHGDPAIRLHPVDGPDYVIDPASTEFSPLVVSTQIDSFTLAFDALNLGRNQFDTLSVSINRTLPDGTSLDVIKDTIVMNRFRKSLSYRLPVGGNQATGENIFNISIETDNVITELPAPAAENNNKLVRSNGEAGVPLFIIDNTARTVYPPEFALVGASNIVLKASTTDALAPERTYWFEIDTSANFDSPSKIRENLRQVGGVLQWTPTFTWQDSIVYYWRVSPATTSENPAPVWSNSSFTYIGGSQSGWSQGHYWQFKEDVQNDLKFTDSTQQIGFGAELLDMRIRNKIWESVDLPGFFYNNDNHARSIRPWLYLEQGVSMIIFEPNNGVGWRNSGQQYGSVDPNNSSCFSFDTSTRPGRSALLDFLSNDVPEGHIVFLFTVQTSETADYLPQEWAQDSLSLGRSIFSFLESEGAFFVRDLAIKGSVPYVFMYTKGAGKMAEGIGENKNSDINVSTILPKLNTVGKLVSKPIGPAKKWNTITWDSKTGTNPTNDNTILHLLGLRQDGVVDTLLRGLTQAQSLASIDASVYPYLQLQYESSDEVNRILPFLKHWTVLYEGVPELAINPANSTYFFQADTLQQGIPLQLRASIENLSTYSSDSVDIEFTVLDAQNTAITTEQIKAGIATNGQLEFEYELPTDELVGRHSLTTSINSKGRQLENHYFNNVLNQNFEVISDDKNPLLDVTFDGQVILNGDLVGANPIITIELKDENPYLLLSDTSLISLRIKYPNGSTERLPMSSPLIQYTPASSANKNVFTIEYQPTFVEDGTYQLAVNGKDVSGNVSGSLDYRVDFEVRTRNSISNVLNYPNPFSTSTQFVYTLTGTPPTFFKIQILTVSGKIVREITQNELGSLQVGTHRTDFAWDGTDEFGDRLANGIYLYRIVAKDEQGKDYESYDNYVENTGLSGFFERGFGKMVLLR